MAVIAVVSAAQSLLYVCEQGEVVVVVVVLMMAAVAAAAALLIDCQKSYVVVVVAVVEGQGGSWTPIWRRPVVGGAEDQETVIHYCLNLLRWLEAAAAVAQKLGCLAWQLVGWHQAKHPKALQGLSESMMDNAEKDRHGLRT